MLGTSDEVLQCECCGKSNLKRTIVIQMTEDSEPVFYGSQCGALALSHRGIEAKGPKLAKLSERIMYAVSDVTRKVADLARLEAMAAAGHVRYLIGGKEIGAELAPLIVDRKADIARDEAKLAGLQDLNTLKVAA